MLPFDIIFAELLYSFKKLSCLVGLFPSNAQILTAHVTVCSQLSVLRTAEVKGLDDSSGTKVKYLVNSLAELVIGNLSCAEGIDHYGNRLCNADSICKLYLALVGKTCGNDVLCNISCSVSGTSVNLCGVLSGESSSAVTCISAVGVNDYLSSCQTAVALRAADNESACGIYEILGVNKQLCGDNGLDDLFDDIFSYLVKRYLGSVLRGYNNGVNSYGLAVVYSTVT